jgi:hypothetical protein
MAKLRMSEKNDSQEESDCRGASGDDAKVRSHLSSAKLLNILFCPVRQKWRPDFSDGAWVEEYGRSARRSGRRPLNFFARLANCW